MTIIPKWFESLIKSNLLMKYVFKISQEYLRRPRSMQFRAGEKTKSGRWKNLYYAVYTKRNLRYDVRSKDREFTCTCDFFKNTGLCSHILAVFQITGTWPKMKDVA